MATVVVSQYFLLVFCKDIVDYTVHILRTDQRFFERSHLSPVASEEVDFRLGLAGGSPSPSLLLLSLFELTFERFPASLLVLDVKEFVIFHMMTNKELRKIVTSLEIFFPVANFRRQ